MASPSICTSLFLLTACRSGYGDDSHSGLSQDANDQAAWARTLNGILDFLPKTFDVSIRVDLEATRVGNYTVGRYPATVSDNPTIFYSGPPINIQMYRVSRACLPFVGFVAAQRAPSMGFGFASAAACSRSCVYVPACADLYSLLNSRASKKNYVRIADGVVDVLNLAAVTEGAPPRPPPARRPT